MALYLLDGLRPLYTDSLREHRSLDPFHTLFTIRSRFGAAVGRYSAELLCKQQGRFA